MLPYNYREWILQYVQSHFSGSQNLHHVKNPDINRYFESESFLVDFEYTFTMTAISDTEFDPGPQCSLEYDLQMMSGSIEASNDGDKDLEMARQEEFDSLKAIYGEDIKFKEWEDRQGFNIKFGKMHLEIVTDHNYPNHPPIHISVTGISVPESINVTAVLTNLANTKRGSCQLFDLIEEARTMTASIELEPPETETMNYMTNFVFPSSQDAAKYLDGITLEMIAKRLEESKVTILHTELIMNPHLVQRFDKMQEKMTLKYTNYPRKFNYDSTEVVFHGTQRKFISNIIARGFVKPGDTMNGTGDKLQVRCGSTFGRGIYTSPEPRYSMSYSDVSDSSEQRIPGQKLIVCAVLMGRRYVCSDPCRERDTAKDGYDSHASPMGFEYIVFNSAQLLPLYVLHVTDGRNLESYWKVRVLQAPPVNLKVGFDVLEERRKTGIEEIDESQTNLTMSLRRKILTRIARKHFPLGFGPAVGNKFFVEEIGAVDDDEEEWGEYQMDSKGYARAGDGISYYRLSDDEDEEEEGGRSRPQHPKDEFQMARNKWFN